MQKTRGLVSFTPENITRKQNAFRLLLSVTKLIYLPVTVAVTAVAVAVAVAVVAAVVDAVVAVVVAAAVVI